MSVSKSFSRRIMAILCAFATIVAFVLCMPELPRLQAEAAASNYEKPVGNKGATLCIFAGNDVTRCDRKDSSRMIDSITRSSSEGYFKIVVNENKTHNDRKAEIYFKDNSNNVKMIYKIKQGGKKLTVERTNGSGIVDAVNGVLTYKVTSNCPFNVTDNRMYSIKITSQGKTLVDKIIEDPDDDSYYGYYQNQLQRDYEVTINLKNASSYDSADDCYGPGESEKTLWSGPLQDKGETYFKFTCGTSTVRSTYKKFNCITCSGSSRSTEVSFSTVLGERLQVGLGSSSFEKHWTKMEDCTWKKGGTQSNKAKFLYWKTPTSGYVVNAENTGSLHEAFDATNQGNAQWEFEINKDYTQMTLTKLNPGVKDLETVNPDKYERTDEKLVLNIKSTPAA